MNIVKEYVNMFNNDLHVDFNVFNPLEKFAKKEQTISMRRIKPDFFNTPYVDWQP